MTKFTAGDKIVITRASSDKFWYSDRIGNEYTIKDYEDSIAHPTIGMVERYTIEEDDGGVIAGLDAEIANPIPSIILCPAQIRAAAEFIEQNNNFINDSVDKIEDKIYSYIRQGARSNRYGRFVKTMGFTLMFSREDGIIEVEVSVDPSLSENVEFVILELDSHSNFVAQYPNR